MQVNRENLLRELESVQAGTTARDTTEQSSCIAFRDGQAITYSDEVACFGPCSLQLTGAVPADPFIKLLQKFPEDEVEIVDEETCVKVKGKGRGMRLTKEAEIVMPVENMEPATEWHALHEDFGDAIRAVGECAAPAKSEEYIMTCIHIHPKWLEACDNFQVARWKIETGLSKPCLVKRDNIKHIAELGMTEFSETEGWLHFRNPSGLHTACRRTADDYKNTAPLFEMPDASPLVLPKGLEEEVDRAIVCTKGSAGGDFVRVELRPDGKMRLMGIGNVVRYWAVKAIQYKGPALKFIIHTKVLAEISKRYTECRINTVRLKAKGAGFVYATCLGALTEAEAGEE
jgi:hypothetical protein